MKNHICNFLLFSFLFLIPATVIPQEKIDFNKLDAQILQAMDTLYSTGAAVGVIKDGKVVFAKGYGHKNYETKDTVTTNTLFGIASCSKAFTAACIGILVQENKLDWNDRVIDLLPGFKLSDPYITRELRVSDLLTHRSGYNTFDGDLLWYGTNYSTEEILKRFELMPAKKSLRLSYGYSNIMFMVAGQVIKSVTGKTWEQFVEERILNPIGMNQTTTTNTVFNNNMDYAYPHKDRNRMDFINYDNVAPAASINSNVNDLLKWLQMWLDDGIVNGDTLLQNDIIQTIFTSQTVLPGGKGDEIGGRHFMNAAMGWFVSDYAGRKLIQHSGGLPGFLSRVTIVPEDNLGIAVLINDESPIYSAITSQIIDMYLTDKQTDNFAKAVEMKNKAIERDAKRSAERRSSRIMGTTHSKSLDEYAGVYEDKMYGTVNITYEKGTLNFVMVPASKLFYGKLSHWHYDSFNIKFADPFLPEGLVTFQTDNKGKISGFKIDLPNPDFHFYNYNFVKID